MAISFPDSLILNQQYSYNGHTWSCNPIQIDPNLMGK